MSRALYLLDTNMIGYLVNARSFAVREKYAEMDEVGDLAISVISEAEIRYGVERKAGSFRLQARVEEFCSSIRILPWDSAAAHAYARLRTGLQASGRSLATMDMLIAAHAVAVDAILVTADQGFGAAVPLLRLENWATDI